MNKLPLYAALSAIIFSVCLLLLNAGAYQEIYTTILNHIIPLWEHPLSRIALFLTDLGGTMAAMIFLGFLTIVLVVEGRFKEAVIIASASLLTALITFFAKEIIALPRPLEQFRITDGSRFPSGHASASMIMALSFIYISYSYTKSRLLRIPLVFIALLFTAIVGATRIFMNVHQPLDIIAGYAVALFSMTIVLILSPRLRDVMKL